MSLLVVALIMAACSKEAALEPSEANDNLFAVDPNATDEESVLRREFYEKTGVHLLFNDTLSIEYIGKDSYGDDLYKVITVDLKYNLTSYNTNPIEYTQFKTIADKRKAANIAEEQILKHFTKGGSLRPYSILLVNDLKGENNNYVYTNVPTLNSSRCVAIDMGRMIDVDDETLKANVDTVLSDIVKKKFKYTDSEAEEILDINDDIRGKYISNYMADWDRSDLSVIYQYGFITYVQNKYRASRDYFPYQKRDFEAFIDAVMAYSEDEFNALYGDYDTVMRKYRLMRNTIKALGYEF